MRACVSECVVCAWRADGGSGGAEHQMATFWLNHFLYCVWNTFRYKSTVSHLLLLLKHFGSCVVLAMRNGICKSKRLAQVEHKKPEKKVIQTLGKSLNHTECVIHNNISSDDDIQKWKPPNQRQIWHRLLHSFGSFAANYGTFIIISGREGGRQGIFSIYFLVFPFCFVLLFCCCSFTLTPASRHRQSVWYMGYVHRAERSCCSLFTRLFACTARRPAS